jgi:hypothetical protein
MAIISQKLGWHTAAFNNETGIVSLVSSTSGPLDLGASESYHLLQFLYTQQELLQLFALREDPPRSGGRHQE